MSQPAYAITPAHFCTPKPATFIAADGTAAKVVVEPYPSAAASGNLPPFYGGCAVLDVIAASSDGSTKDILVYFGKVLTTQDTGASGALTITSQNTLSRVSGSFVTDGWRAGDLLMVFATPSTAQVAGGLDGVLATVTAVADLTITVNGTPWAAGTHTLTAGTRIVNVSQLLRTTVPANSGNSATVPNTTLLGSAMDTSVVRTEFKLGPDAMLIAGMQAAVSALPAFVSVQARTARY